MRASMVPYPNIWPASNTTSTPGAAHPNITSTQIIHQLRGAAHCNNQICSLAKFRCASRAKSQKWHETSQKLRMSHVVINCKSLQRRKTYFFFFLAASRSACMRCCSFMALSSRSAKADFFLGLALFLSSNSLILSLSIR